MSERDVSADPGVWQARAKCRGMDYTEFFPERSPWSRRDEVPAHVQAVCGACDVSQDCLEHALHHGEHGIWGGTTERQRQAMRRRIKRAHCPGCDSSQLHTADGRQVCLSCGASWVAVKHRTPGHPHRRRRRTA